MEVRVSVRVHAGAQPVWDALTDWESQSTWIALTRVRPVGGDGHGVGGRFEAFTGVGRFGVLDTMVITEWQPPTWCAVRHTGSVMRGTGAFEVVPAAAEAGGSILTWSEDLDIPGGRIGERAFALVVPLIEYALLRSLRRFARLVERRGGASAA